MLSIYMAAICYDNCCKSYTHTCGDLHSMQIAMNNYDKRFETVLETPSCRHTWMGCICFANVAGSAAWHCESYGRLYGSTSRLLMRPTIFCQNNLYVQEQFHLALHIYKCFKHEHFHSPPCL